MKTTVENNTPLLLTTINKLNTKIALFVLLNEKTYPKTTRIIHIEMEKLQLIKPTTINFAHTTNNENNVDE